MSSERTEIRNILKIVVEIIKEMKPSGQVIKVRSKAKDSHCSKVH